MVAALLSSGSVFFFVLAKNILGAVNDSQDIDLVRFDVIDDPVWPLDHLSNLVHIRAPVLCVRREENQRSAVIAGSGGQPSAWHTGESLGQCKRRWHRDALQLFLSNGLSFRKAIFIPD